MPVKAPPNKLLIAPHSKAEWAVSDMLTLQFGNNCYLRLPFGDKIITVYGTRETMVSKLRQALADFDYNLEKAKVAPRLL